jgi:hypothetical protein
MFLRHRYISHKRRQVIGVKIPLYEVPWSDESTSLNELFSTSSRQERSLIGYIEQVPVPRIVQCQNFLCVLTGWLSAPAPKVIYTSEGPVALPALPEFKKLFIKNARFLECS